MDVGAASSSPPPLRIVVFPWLAFGHILPFMELAERLASRGHRVSFVSTPGNIARLPTLRPAAAPRVDLVSLPLPRVDGLPDGVESTNSVPRDKFHLLFSAFDGLAEPFAEFLGAACADDGERPDWIIVDLFHYWAAAAAAELKVPCAMVLATSAACMVSVRDGRRGSSRADPAAAPAPPRYESELNAKHFTTPVASGMSVAERITLTCARSTLTALRSCSELEPELFPLVAPFLRKPVVPLGLHPSSPDDGGAGAGMSGEQQQHAAVRWLDAQPASSVVYVALGSEVPVRAELVRELALGLELAGTRFLWALRKPTGGVPDPDADVLPPGFQDRTHGRGLVATGWVPQTSILAHAAVGGFLTHCGWSSLVEGLLHGCPLIMLPIFGDQGPNARLMERKKVGLLVARDDSDGSFDRHGVASAVRAAMLEEESRGIFVENALKVQEMVADNDLHERYIDGFIQQLRSYAAGSHSSTAVPPPAVD
ncbi:hypothetical protein U9M48_009963 [Paspalum notatum var. saurae]|uniref:Glycosyltransferase n=1 Tax=Paspalum notatum var. saurae TaxID=547442 RepID=A0AAQ3SSD2_PASNO